MSERATLFVKSLAVRFPGLASLLEQHVADNFGEVLPHLFFGGLARYVLSLLAAGARGSGSPAQRELREILDVLEDAYVEGDKNYKH